MAAQGSSLDTKSKVSRGAIRRM